MPVLDSTHVELNGASYRLLRESVAREIAQRGGPRRWKVESKPQATTVIPKANVRRGAIAGEFVVTYDDFSKGVSGAHGYGGGSYHYSGADGVPETSGGPLFAGGDVESGNANTDIEATPSKVLVFNNILFVVAGRYVYRVEQFPVVSSPVLTQDVDFGSGVTATDAIVFNNELVVGFGGATNKIRSRNTAGTWTTATDNTYADFFAQVESRLWRATVTNEVSNIASTDNPLTLASWSSGIPVGDDDVAITGLIDYGIRVAVSKTDGLYLGEAAAVFPNVLPGIIPDPDNGRGLVSRGTDVFYPHKQGLWRYSGGRAEEIGISTTLREVTWGDAATPGYRVRSLAIQGRNIWALTDGAYMRVLATETLRTTDNEVSFTASSGQDYITLNSQDTAANGDYFYVGHSTTQFQGIYIFTNSPNMNAAVLTVEFWNGSAWATVANATNPLRDDTSLSGVTLRKSGPVLWGILLTWATRAINGTTAYWIRCSVSAALDSAVTITTHPILWRSADMWRGRPRQEGDPMGPSILWEHMWKETYARAVIGLSHQAIWGIGPSLVVADRRGDVSFNQIQNSPTEPTRHSHSSEIILAREDGGFPNIRKQWTQITLRGQNMLSPTNDVEIDYRTNESTTWTTGPQVNNDVTFTSALSAVTGLLFQLRILINDHSHPAPAGIYSIEVTFRPLFVYKDETTMLLELTDGTETSGGGMIPGADEQLTALKALRGASAVTFDDPTGLSDTVNVFEVDQVELGQFGLDYPLLVCEVRCAEV